MLAIPTPVTIHPADAPTRGHRSVRRLRDAKSATRVHRAFSNTFMSFSLCVSGFRSSTAVARRLRRTPPRRRSRHRPGAEQPRSRDARDRHGDPIGCRRAWKAAASSPHKKPTCPCAPDREPRQKKTSTAKRPGSAATGPQPVPRARGFPGRARPARRADAMRREKARTRRSRSWRYAGPSRAPIRGSWNCPSPRRPHASFNAALLHARQRRSRSPCLPGEAEVVVGRGGSRAAASLCQRREGLRADDPVSFETVLGLERLVIARIVRRLSRRQADPDRSRVRRAAAGSPVSWVPSL